MILMTPRNDLCAGHGPCVTGGREWVWLGDFRRPTVPALMVLSVGISPGILPEDFSGYWVWIKASDCRRRRELLRWVIRTPANDVPLRERYRWVSNFCWKIPDIGIFSFGQWRIPKNPNFPVSSVHFTYPHTNASNTSDTNHKLINHTGGCSPGLSVTVDFVFINIISVMTTTVPAGGHSEKSRVFHISFVYIFSVKTKSVCTLCPDCTVLGASVRV